MITVSNVSLRRADKLLFKDANFSAYSGHRVGLTGANGCGKSSFMSMLTHDINADLGDITIPPSFIIATVAQHVERHQGTAIDFVMAGDRALMAAKNSLQEAEQSGDNEALAAAYEQLENADAYTAESRSGQLLAGLGFTSDQQQTAVNAFSGGWRMRLNLARALMIQSDILLLDEPTNHLDLDAIIWLESWLKRYNGCLMIISHDRDFLDSICTHIAHIEQQTISHYNGNYSEFEKQRAARLANQTAAFIKQQKNIAHMQKFIDRFGAKATKAKQAQSRVKALAKLTSIAPAHIDSPFSFEFQAPSKDPKQLIQTDNLQLGYQDATILSKVNINIEQGARIGLLGANGTGKSTLIKAIAGELDAQQGSIDRAKEINIGYFAQYQLDQLRPDDTPLSHLSRAYSSRSEAELRRFLGGFGFIGNQAISSIEPMSGGEKARLVLATLVLKKPNLLLLDEPTNHLDLEMRYALNVALQSYQGSLLVISHDRHLLETVTDELWLVTDGQLTHYDGDLEQYAKWLLNNRVKDFTDSNSSANTQAAEIGSTGPIKSSETLIDKKNRKREAAELRAKLKPLTQRCQQIEAQLSQHEETLNSIENELALPSIYDDNNKQRLAAAIQQQGQLKLTVTQLESEWLEINEQLEIAHHKE
ncbi:MAG: ABC transporter ATP-binding protein [Cellvibrionales bacterium]|nr:ABC transporter ATP-binding protein [Cellvibrionales bacterium]|tara:strand:- start:3395 stop:5338 length:1944 start_codon:yes stop_codon:yes gene_type:complete